MTGLLDGLHPDGRAPRLLFVLAHPDDETLATGVAIAHHVARGDDVHVLTCTLGEEGEVIPAHLAHLEGAPGDPLAAHRREELRGAMEVLGVTHHQLGTTGDAAHPVYRDSGMAGSPAASHPRAWAGADLADAAAAVRAVLDEVRPDVVVTYDATGGYGHPDHVRTHEATCRAVAVPVDDDPFASSVVPDAVVTHTVVDPSVVPVQSRALLAHETQVVVGDGWYALSNHVVSRLAGREGYARLDAATGRPTPQGAP